MAMQTAAPHNVESDAIQLSDEYRAVDVPLSCGHFSPSFAVDPPQSNQTDIINFYYQLR